MTSLPRRGGAATRRGRPFGHGTSRSRKRWLLLTALLPLLTGCNASWIPNMAMPHPATKEGQAVLELWRGSWLAALGVGGIVWGLIGWAIVRYRKKSDELPRQVRYNLPIEFLYTALPVVAITVLFYYTVNVQNTEDRLSATLPADAQVINVTGFQWNWQFGYVDEGLQITGRPGIPAVLVLPTDTKIRFVESSPDVIHSFWVPAFLFKRDVVPGRDNQFELTITQPGSYIGRCAELCGVDHDRMDFFVTAMPPDQFRAWLAKAKSGAVNGALTKSLPMPAGVSQQGHQAATQPAAGQPAGGQLADSRGATVGAVAGAARDDRGSSS